MISYPYDENADPKPLRGADLANEDGFAYVICRDCGELDEEGQFLEKNTLHDSGGTLTNDAMSARAMGSCGWL